MTRFYGPVGYSHTVESAPGVAKNVIVERMYFGDVLGNTGKLVEADTLNPNLGIQGQISIVADPYAYGNFMLIKYVVWMGIRWKVSTIDASTPPRIVLRLGEVYNGNTPTATDSP